MSDLYIARIKRFHNWIVIDCVYYCINMVNSFPARLSVSQILFPGKIVTGRTLDFKVDLRALFGAYVKASYNRDVTNTP